MNNTVQLYPVEPNAVSYNKKIEISQKKCLTRFWAGSAGQKQNRLSFSQSMEGAFLRVSKLQYGIIEQDRQKSNPNRKEVIL